MKIVERTHNIETGEIIDIERDATPEEINRAEQAKKEAEMELAARAQAEAKKAALLQKLGITEEEAKLLIP